MRLITARRVLSVAAVCAIAGLLMVLWSLFSPSPMVLVASMSIGQGLGTLSFVLYIGVVVVDLWRRAPEEEEAAEIEEVEEKTEEVVEAMEDVVKAMKEEPEKEAKAKKAKAKKAEETQEAEETP